MIKQRYPDLQQVDIARPIEHKKFKLTTNMVIIILLILVWCLLVKIFIIDAILFNPNLELEIFQRDLAFIFAKMTRVPEVNIDFSQIDTTNLATVFRQTLEYFVVNPIMQKAETQIMNGLDSIFGAVSEQSKLLI